MLWLLQQQPLYLAQLSQYIRDEARTCNYPVSDTYNAGPYR